jgi:hypothetical protein
VAGTKRELYGGIVAHHNTCYLTPLLTTRATLHTIIRANAQKMLLTTNVIGPAHVSLFGLLVLYCCCVLYWCCVLQDA